MAGLRAGRQLMRVEPHSSSHSKELYDAQLEHLGDDDLNSVLQMICPVRAVEVGRHGTHLKKSRWFTQRAAVIACKVQLW